MGRGLRVWGSGIGVWGFGVGVWGEELKRGWGSHQQKIEDVRSAERDGLHRRVAGVLVVVLEATRTVAERARRLGGR